MDESGVKELGSIGESRKEKRQVSSRSRRTRSRDEFQKRREGCVETHDGNDEPISLPGFVRHLQPAPIGDGACFGERDVGASRFVEASDGGGERSVDDVLLRDRESVIPEGKTTGTSWMGETNLHARYKTSSNVDEGC